MDNKNKILLVEDDPIIERVHREFLQRMGFIVEVAVTGQQTLDMCSTHFYHLIILDGGLPDKSCVEVGQGIRRLEKNHKTARKPILLLSAYSPDLLNRWCKEAEIDSFAIKPIRYADLFSMLDSYFSKGKFSHSVV
jgi:CheY-like chemotaxis protein